MQPFKASACCSLGLINEVMRERGSHIYPMCGIFYLPSIGTGTRGRQFNVSSERHPAGILWWRSLENFGFSARGSNPGPPAQQTSTLTTRPPSCHMQHTLFVFWFHWTCPTLFLTCCLIIFFLYFHIYYTSRINNTALGDKEPTFSWLVDKKPTFSW